jgi:hypothetical protein
VKTILLSIFVVLLGAPNTIASPCTSLDRGISDARKAEIAAPIAAQLKTDRVDILGYTRLKGWSIIHVEPTNADDAFLFFKSDPGKSHYVTLWAGAATIFEEQAIKQWVLKNAHGIPEKLAACIAWGVTQNPND